MEHFRRWGIDEQVLAAGLPQDYPPNVIFTTRLFDKEITRWATVVKSTGARVD